MKVLEFLMAHWDDISIIVVALLGLISAIIKKDKKLIFELLFKFISDAEGLFGSKTGILKKSYVITELYKVLPATLITFLPKSLLDKWVEDALEVAKKQWENNPEIIKVLEKIGDDSQ